jgi:two-component system, OmpR family, phosphate regulon sensor histidine kinase PhoR
MVRMIPEAKWAPVFRERFSLGERLCWLAAGFAVGATLLFLRAPYAPELLVIAGLVSVAFGLALSRRNEVESAAASNGADIGATALPPRAREMLERLPDPLMLLDESNRVVLANTAMTALVGTEANNKHVSSVLRTPALLEAIERIAATGLPQSVAFSLRVPTEQHYQAHVTCTEHTPRLTAVLLHNVTAMVRAQEARSDFIANASHELRTPLAALSGFIDTLRGHARDDEEAREKFLDIMSGEANRMRRLIDDLLSLTRIEQNEHVPPEDEVDIHGVLSEAAAALQGLASLDKVTLSIAQQDDLPPVLGDRDELAQLFQNLMHNAIKYGRQQGVVRVTFSRHPGESAVPGRHGVESLIAVAVRDDGEGIPREAIPRLTERFYRVDVRRSRERGGTGLGLAIVKHIVSRHHGRLLIDSQPGEGSTFTVLLPAVPQAEPRPSRK